MIDRRDRLARCRGRMAELGVDALLLSVGPDLPYLVGYEAMPLERLTMLVLPLDGDARLVVPRLEAPRVDEPTRALVEVVAWEETDDPIALVASLVGSAANIAVGDHTWARFVIDLQRALGARTWRRASEIVAPLRAVKTADELEVLRAAARAVDAVALAMRDRPFAGRPEIEVHRELVERMLEAGHQRANFAIVATAANAASPHHEPGTRVIAEGDLVLCDFGGTYDGYCSDITRMFHVGTPPAEIVDLYAILREAQQTGVRSGAAGVTAQDVDRATRGVIDAAGYGEFFVHRTGHGIGTEAHEDPYIVEGNATPLEIGHAYSVEPGIYLPGRFGMRLEDIVAITPEGSESLNAASHDLLVVG